MDNFFDENAVIERIKGLRCRFSGLRGKSEFAKALGISPSTYNYYEQKRIPPVETLLKISQITGADLHWILTGQCSNGSSGEPKEPFLEKIQALLAEHTDMKEPLSAFVDLLCEKKNFTNRPVPTSNDKDIQESDWIPVLGRTAAGIVHCWDETTMPDASWAVTKLGDLVKQHTGKEILNSSDAPIAIDMNIQKLSDSISDSKANLIRVKSEKNEAVEFIECNAISESFPDCFALHVDGDSMAPRINDGDIVLVSPSVKAVEGQVAIAHISNQIGVTCKLLRTSDKGTHLIPINEKYDIKIVPDEDMAWALAVLCHINI